MTRAEWVDHVGELVGLIEQGGRKLMDLADPPQPAKGETPQQQLQDLRRLWQRLEMKSSSPEALDHRINQAVARLRAQEQFTHSGMIRLLHKVRAGVEKLLEAGVDDPGWRVLRPKDFGDRGTLTVIGSPRMLFGDPDTLPRSHWGRSLVPPESLYRLGARPVLVLGFKECAWFQAEEVATLTRNWRGAQVLDEQEKTRQEALRERAKQEQREATSEYKLELLQKELADMREQMAALQREKAAANGAHVPAQEG